MGRLIDTDELIANVASIVDLRTLSTKTIGEAIAKTPTVDAVPVVRCRDCRWWDVFPRSTASPAYHECKARGISAAADDFCKLGERKDSEENG